MKQLFKMFLSSAIDTFVYSGFIVLGTYRLSTPMPYARHWPEWTGYILIIAGVVLIFGSLFFFRLLNLQLEVMAKLLLKKAETVMNNNITTLLKAFDASRSKATKKEDGPEDTE